MRGFFRLLIAAVVLATGFGTPVAAGDLRPDGYWITEGQKARYYVTSCGNGQLCAVLLWIRPDLVTERNVKFLNTAIFENLPRQDETRWSGEVTLDGHTVQGLVEMVTYDEIRVTGCVFILCDTVVMSRLPDSG
ncbi:MAG: DUF2147 domain-containing protein [Cucumibacter sp.]